MCCAVLCTHCICDGNASPLVHAYLANAIDPVQLVFVTIIPIGKSLGCVFEHTQISFILHNMRIAARNF